jgi:hypothetical protein
MNENENLFEVLITNGRGDLLDPTPLDKYEKFH